jgi:hypothetical protein
VTEIVNLKRARKAKDAAAKSKKADENRAKFGRTKAQRSRDREEERRRNALLDGAIRQDRDET